MTSSSFHLICNKLLSTSLYRTRVDPRGPVSSIASEVPQTRRCSSTSPLTPCCEACYMESNWSIMDLALARALAYDMVYNGVETDIYANKLTSREASLDKIELWACNVHQC